MPFRIAIGRCDCRQPGGDSLAREACEMIDAHLSAWRKRLPADLGAVPIESFEMRTIDGRPAILGTQKCSVEEGTLVVVHVFIYTWRWPTIFSLSRIGRLYAEGILITREGHVETPPDSIMWEFR